MDEFVEDLILGYIKTKKGKYSFRELAEILGISKNVVTRHIQQLIEDGKLEYKNSLLSITLHGRVQIQNKPVDYFDFTNENIDYHANAINPEKAWPLDKVYIPDSFSGKSK